MIRAATPNDAAKIARVHVQAWRETYSGLMPQSILDGLSVETRIQQWQRTLQAATHGVFVLELDNLLGFSSVGPTQEGGHFDAELHTLYLLQAQQGHGFGRGLWNAACGFAQSHGAKSLMLWVLENNPTRGFYEHLGGTLEGRKTESISGFEIVEVAYSFELQGAKPLA